MKTILFLMGLSLMLSCSLQKKELVSSCNHPNFGEWKEVCIAKTNEHFGDNDTTRGNTIISFVKSRINRINTEEQERFFCETFNNKKENHNEFILIYHYLESESNYVVQSFIFKERNTYKGIAWDPDLDRVKRYKEKCFFDKMKYMESNHINSGLLIVSYFHNYPNNSYVLKKTDIYYGPGFANFNDLAGTYPPT